MANKVKIKDDSLEHDEIAESLIGAASTVSANRYKVAIGALVIAGAVALGITFKGNQEKVQTQASDYLNQASAIFAQIPAMKDQTEREKKLRELIDNLQTSVIDRYSDSPATLRALFLQGNCYYALEDVKKAQEAFQKFTDAAKLPSDKAEGMIALGLSYENQFYLQPQSNESLDLAIAEYKKAEDTAPKGSYLTYQAMMARARVLELTSKDKEALELYRKVEAERKPPAPESATKVDDTPGQEMNLQSYARRQVAEQLKLLSFQTTAKLRADRVEATSKVLNPGLPGIAGPTKPAAAPATPAEPAKTPEPAATTAEPAKTAEPEATTAEPAKATEAPAEPAATEPAATPAEVK